jgi:hypothetical protein
MRKLLFAALAGVFMFSSGFSSFDLSKDVTEEIQDEIFECASYIQVSGIGAMGEPVEEITNYTRETDDAEGCQNYINTVSFFTCIAWNGYNGNC